MKCSLATRHKRDVIMTSFLGLSMMVHFGCSSGSGHSTVPTTPGKVTWLVSRSIDRRGFALTVVNRGKDYLAMPRYGVTALTLLSGLGMEVRPDVGVAERSVLEADWVVIAPENSESWSVPPGNNKIPKDQGFEGYGARVTIYTKTLASLPMPQFCKDAKAQVAEPPMTLELDKERTL